MCTKIAAHAKELRGNDQWRRRARNEQRAAQHRAQRHRSGLQRLRLLPRLSGIFAGEYEQMTSFSVSGLLSRGGSALGCARSAEMLEPDGPARCAAKLKELGVDALLAIGGDGTFRGLV